MDSLKCKGFKASGMWCGLKKAEEPDLGMIYSENPAAVAAVFTKNQVKAAPVVLDRERIRFGICHGILANSGCANCCTGEEGMRNAVASAAAVAAELKISEDRILVASTGVIGEQLRVEKIKRAVPELIRNLSSDGFSDFARAIMTTDTTAKIVSRQGQLGEKTFTVLGVAKGSGMIRPDMATMLCFVCIDLKIAPDVLKEMLALATEHSFNKITVDGDMSTNDTVIAMANGACGATVEKGSEKSVFQDVLDDVLFELAKMIVRDGEGATRLVEIVVKNASSDEDAKAAADAVANSLLVKTALFGEDANWGRIMAALGRSGAKVVPEKVDVYFDQIRLVQNGLLSSAYLEKDAERILKQNEYVISMDLKLGNGSASVFTCDLSVDYVKINADYRS